MSSYIYVASPYSSPSKLILRDRFHAVLDYTAHLLQGRFWCYSPIVHCHELALYHDLPKDFAFWKEYNEAMLGQAEEMHVLALGGWKDSIGVEAEINLAAKYDIPVVLIDPISYGPLT
jgi:hypothetical protein